jgi:hypothetical protein
VPKQTGRCATPWVALSALGALAGAKGKDAPAGRPAARCTALHPRAVALALPWPPRRVLAGNCLKSAYHNHVRFASESDQVAASPRIVAKGQFRTHALQKTFTNLGSYG